MLEAREQKTKEEGWTRPAPGTAGLWGMAPHREGVAGVWGTCLCCAANQLCGVLVAGAPLGILETESPGVRPGRGHSASACPVSRRWRWLHFCSHPLFSASFSLF